LWEGACTLYGMNMMTKPWCTVIFSGNPLYYRAVYVPCTGAHCTLIRFLEILDISGYCSIPIPMYNDCILVKFKDYTIFSSSAER